MATEIPKAKSPQKTKGKIRQLSTEPGKNGTPDRNGRRTHANKKSEEEDRRTMGRLISEKQREGEKR